MTTIEIIGFTSAFLTTFSFLPQAIQVIKTRDTASLSLAMYSIFTIGVAGWLAYGLIKQDMAMIVANMVTFVLAGIILAIKLYNAFITDRKSTMINADNTTRDLSA
ncbi:SemiSWEET transporter [Catenovulum maritimum]|uniref:Glutathione synthetase n=1 Tax=Catenovulum maritimum TaxID=1513271 RepID=A0A0J8H0S8_9ALTE|nr:SemiSWEET transporter [Catenovulum maritimum]KMT67054.1 glutathione synthetase [Catenovulum maritimum]